ncbi:metallo-beta-lactamase [Myxozyma melibiosi]|uniref:Metallo-beta-lactamase n=1 Tax=Myxozyma melibiosi TaxID=54550 RepID=A0ABR1F544_9ASCO
MIEFSLDLPICNTCGAQFGTTSPPKTCPVCDDPRQWVPPSGQSYTTLGALQTSEEKYHNVIEPDSNDADLYSVYTVPHFAIGQRAVLMVRDGGKANVLWDCISYIDSDTVDKITAMGGISAIFISHPHFYSSHVEWARAFGCKVYISSYDKQWVMRSSPDDQVFYDEDVVSVEDQAKADKLTIVRVGGHFPGSAVCLWKETHLLVADSIGIVLSGLGERERLPGTITFTFMWSYPNMIPLSPDAVFDIWKALKPFNFEIMHGGWADKVVKTDVKKRLLESCKIFVEKMGYTQHAVFEEEL